MPDIAGDLLDVAMAHAGRNDWGPARAALEQALGQPAQRQQAQFLLWEVCQVLGDPGAAVAHLRAAVATAPLVARLSATPSRHVLAIAVPGDFQANLPIAMLLTEATTSLTTFWLDDPASVLAAPAAVAARLPDDIDAVFIVIAEDARHADAVRAADCLAAALGRPVINPGAMIAAASRDAMAERLAGIAGAIVPKQHLRHRHALADMPPAFPAIIRPRASHAGHGLARLGDAAELADYLAGQVAEDWFFVAPFIDYRSADGQWRKYRVIFVAGVAFPFHLAVHDDWAVWYYNAGMADNPTKQAEERRFLDDISSVFPPAAMQALADIAARVGLDYFGLDCGLLDNGDVVVFEVETGMIVHDRNEGSAFEYKILPARKILRAVEGMIDGRVKEALLF